MVHGKSVEPKLRSAFPFQVFESLIPDIRYSAAVGRMYIRSDIYCNLYASILNYLVSSGTENKKLGRRARGAAVVYKTD